MSKSMCITQKRVRKVKNINPAVEKVRAVDSIRIQRQLNSTGKTIRFEKRNSQLLSATRNDTSKLPVWGTAADIDF